MIGPHMPGAKQVVCTTHDVGPTMVRVVADCPECGNRFRSPAFDQSKLKELESRHVQDVFPDWTPADRELYFMAGVCGKCWDRMFKEEP